MKLRRILSLLIALACSPPLWSQNSGSITTTSASTGNGCIPLDASRMATVSIQISGTWTGTLTPEISIGGQTPQTIQVTPANSSTPQTSITANNVYYAAGGGIVMVCGPTSTGTANVFLQPIPGSASKGGVGGGSGTISGVTAGTGLSGGGSSGSVTLNLATPVTAANGGTGVANTATLTLGTSGINFATLGTGIVKNTTTTGALSDAAVSDVTALFSTCSGTQYLGFDGNCHTAGTGTVNSSTQYALGIYPNSGSNTVIGGSSGLTTDAANDLTIAGNETSNQNSTSGSGGGQMAVTQGVTQAGVANGFSFQAPTTIANPVQVVPPAAVNAGFWEGFTVATGPSATCTVSAGNVTACTTSFAAGSASGTNGYATAPPCAISTTGAGSGATCTINVTGTAPNLIPSSFTVLSQGTGYTGTITAGLANTPINLQFIAQIPIGSVGTSGLSATAPVAISAAGAITCSTCATTTNGGALSGTAPITISAAGAIACATCVTSAASLANNALVVGSGGAQGTATGNGDFTYSTHTLTGGASAVFDMHAATGQGALLIPSNTTNTCAAAACFNFDTTNNDYHIYVNGTDSFVVNETASTGITANIIPKSAGTTRGAIQGSSISDNGSFVTTAEVISGGNTVRIVADSGSITATTAATATTVFTLPTLKVSTNYSIHCSGTTVQSTAGAGIGIAVTFATTAPTNAELHALVNTSATAINGQSTGSISTTTATAIYTGATGTVTTQLPWYIDGSIEVGATAPSSIVIGFFSISASDGVVVKRDSFCSIMS